MLASFHVFLIPVFQLSSFTLFYVCSDNFFLSFNIYYSMKNQDTKLKFFFSIQGSFDIEKKISAPPVRRQHPSLDFDKSPVNNGTADFFSLIGVHDGQKDPITVSSTPTSWTKFDCKTIILMSHIIFCNLSFIFLFSSLDKKSSWRFFLANSESSWYLILKL